MSGQQRPSHALRTSEQSDEVLARLAQDGVPDAFGALVGRHTPAARRVARVILQDDHDADDAAQEAFLSAWQAIGRYDPRRAFRPWLFRIVLNAARDLRRRRVVRTTERIPESAGGGDSPERLTDASLFRERLQQALATLPERQRIAVTLFDAEGYTHAEIARLLGVPAGTVRSDVFHARRALRAVLAPFYGGTE